jgi:hypothetical protein
LWIVVAAVCVLGVVGIAAWSLFVQSDPKPWNKPANVDGAIVRLTYTGSECRDGADVAVDENATRVVITVSETTRARDCSDVGVTYDIQLQLDEPLADRQLLDGACQMSEYGHYLECAPDKPTVETSSGAGG